MLTVHIANDLPELDISVPQLERLVDFICKRFSLTNAAVNVAIVCDDRIKQLNAQFLGHDCTTDCLSFDLTDAPPGSPRLLDIVVNAEMAVRQAEGRSHGHQAELALYVTHGLLHQLGFDDADPEQAEAMHRAEDEILQHLGYGLVYNDHRD